MTQARPTTPDDFYEIILSMHKGLTEAESEKANAKLIIALADHLNDKEALQHFVTLVRDNTLKQRSGQKHPSESGQ